MKRILVFISLGLLSGCVSIPGPESPTMGIFQIFLKSELVDINALDAETNKQKNEDLTITLYLINLENGQGYPLVCEGGSGYFLAYNLPAGEYELSKIYATYYYLVKEAGTMTYVSSSGIQVSRPADKKNRVAAHKLLYRSGNGTFPRWTLPAQTVFYYGVLGITVMVDPNEALVTETKPMPITTGSVRLLSSTRENFVDALRLIMDLKVADSWPDLRMLSRE